jgi:hypothetical protein
VTFLEWIESVVYAAMPEPLASVCARHRVVVVAEGQGCSVCYRFRDPLPSKKEPAARL